MPMVYSAWLQLTMKPKYVLSHQPVCSKQAPKYQYVYIYIYTDRHMQSVVKILISNMLRQKEKQAKAVQGLQRDRIGVIHASMLVGNIRS